jgi:GNAT superfamily N-acetyltransferase
VTTLQGVDIRPFEPHTASDKDYEALNAFQNGIKAESWPSEPQTTVQELRDDWVAIPSYQTYHCWAAWVSDRAVAFASVSVSNKDNLHLAHFELAVAPERRRRGLAARLLANIAQAAAAEGRRTLMAFSSSLVPAADAFAGRIGAAPGRTMLTNLLDLKELNADTIAAWLKRGEALAPEFEMGFWRGTYPDSDLSAIAQMHGVMNDMPRGTLELEDEVWTPEILRDRERTLAQRETERWTCYLRDRTNQRLAGYTEVFWTRYQPESLQQGDTGVLPEYRQRGLGTWLKAAMIEWVLRERPQLKRVRTWNADSNAPMLRINYSMGFKLELSSTHWQISLQDLQAYLASKQ